MDGKACGQLKEFGRIERRARIIFGQRLLCRADDPDLTVANILEILGQPIQVEDQVRARADILAHFIDDKDDKLFARFFTCNFNHLLDAIRLKTDNVRRFRGKGRR